MSTAIQTEPNLSEVQFEHTPNFAHVLEQMQVTLLVSTYHAGKLLVIGSHTGKLSFAFHGFDQVSPSSPSLTDDAASLMRHQDISSDLKSLELDK